MNKIPFKNRYVSLGTSFFTKTLPLPVSNPELIECNEDLAEVLGLSNIGLNSPDNSALFAGNVIPDGAEPLAMVYAGHQFSYFNPQLGDGRAVLLGEVVSPDGRCFGLQLKGSGPTCYSRRGDGRSALGPSIREFLVSEAMAKLGVPTTRALALVTTGEKVARERPLPGGILTRVATSFVRAGTFEYFSARGDLEAVQKLADYIIKHHYSEVKNAKNPYVAFLKAVLDRQAILIAKWMQFGFIHGVMNTDNMSIVGETIDYGPCAFMDDYSHSKVFSYIDREGRYAYGNQAPIGMWNLTRLAEALLPLFDPEIEDAVEIAKGILGTYRSSYQRNWLSGMRSKFGLNNNVSDLNDVDYDLIEDLFATMEAGKADFTLTFSRLSELEKEPSGKDEKLRSLFAQPEDLDQWLVQWRKRLDKESQSDEERQAKMQTINPIYIPRNHQVEAAIRAAEDHNDFSVFRDLHQVLKNPYTRQKEMDHYELAPTSNEVVKRTFCGT